MCCARACGVAGRKRRRHRGANVAGTAAQTSRRKAQASRRRARASEACAVDAHAVACSAWECRGSVLGGARRPHALVESWISRRHVECLACCQPHLEPRLSVARNRLGTLCGVHVVSDERRENTASALHSFMIRLQSCSSASRSGCGRKHVGTGAHPSRTTRHASAARGGSPRATICSSGWPQSRASRGPCGGEAMRSEGKEPTLRMFHCPTKRSKLDKAWPEEKGLWVSSHYPSPRKSTPFCYKTSPSLGACGTKRRARHA